MLIGYAAIAVRISVLLAPGTLRTMAYWRDVLAIDIWPEPHLLPTSQGFSSLVLQRWLVTLYVMSYFYSGTISRGIQKNRIGVKQF